MITTIQISEKLRDALNKKKLYDRESYEDIIWELIEDNLELSEETKKDIEQARKEIKAGRHISHEQVKKELGLA